MGQGVQHLDARDQDRRAENRQGGDAVPVPELRSRRAHGGAVDGGEVQHGPDGGRARRVGDDSAGEVSAAGAGEADEHQEVLQAHLGPVLPRVRAVHSDLRWGVSIWGTKRATATKMNECWGSNHGQKGKSLAANDKLIASWVNR